MRLHKNLGLLLFLTVIMIAVLLVAGCAPNIDKLIEEKDVDGLIEALKYESDDVRDVRQDAASALGDIGDVRGVEPLIKALGDEDSNVRRGATNALGDIGEPAVESLIKALGDEDSNVRRGAAHALGDIGYRQALKTQLLDEDSGSYVWVPEEVEALRKIGEPAVEPLIKALGDEVASVRQSAANALGDIGYSYVGVLGVWDEDSGNYVLVPKIGEPAVEPLIKALGDENSYVREEAAWALGKIGDPRAVEPLNEVSNDEDSEVRVYAKNALSRLGGYSSK